MTNNATPKYRFSGHGIILTMILCLFGLCVAQYSFSARKRAYRKPVDKRVYLIHADVLHYDQFRNPDAQILNGHVKFIHQGARLTCDSAYFYEASNSFEAFGHVKMFEGDTLSLFSDYAFYDGNEQLARARKNVVLKHRKTTLYTDSLDYDRLYNVGYFFEGGKLLDKGSKLTSDWGEYNTSTRMAAFNFDVRLRNKKFYLTTDTLYYDTRTSLAHAVGPTHIQSGKSNIKTNDGYYNTHTEKARLFGRSTLVDGDRTMVGDSVYYDSKKRVSQAYRNVVYTDKRNKNKITGNYCYYNEKTGFALATNHALAIDYSQKDSLFMHADTFKIFTYHINTDSVYRKIHAYHKVRAYRIDVQAVCDSLVYNTKDSCLSMYKDPIVWNNSQQLLGEVINVYMKDSTINRAQVIGQALSIEQMKDTIHYNQITSREMMAYFRHGDIYESDAIDNVQSVYYPVDDADSSLIGLNYVETPLMKAYMQQKKLQKVWASKSTGTIYPLTQIPPEKKFLPNYAWFDYIRPLNKDDIFNWRGKKSGTELKIQKRRPAPGNKSDNKSSAKPVIKLGDNPGNKIVRKPTR
jgi:lipopolysaccharide assembly outer membrane protein LptD (OstA)